MTIALEDDREDVGRTLSQRRPGIPHGDERRSHEVCRKGRFRNHDPAKLIWRIKIELFN